MPNPIDDAVNHPEVVNALLAHPWGWALPLGVAEARAKPQHGSIPVTTPLVAPDKHPNCVHVRPRRVTVLGIDGRTPVAALVDVAPKVGLREGHGGGELRGGHGGTGLDRLRHLTELPDDSGLLGLDAVAVVPAHVGEQGEDSCDDSLGTHEGRYARKGIKTR